MEELDHQEFSLDPISDLDPAVAYTMVRRAALRHDCSTDPVAQAVLDWSENQLGNNPRVHGAGGEFGRGFYYPGQWQHKTIGPALVNRLAKWRLFTNEPAETACMSQVGADWVREATLAQLRDVFYRYDRDWLSATGNFYLRERMVRWAGSRLSVASTERILLGSLMHPEFVALVHQCPPEYKRNSRFMAEVLHVLDPTLAGIPLDSRYVPNDLGSSDPGAQLRRYRITGLKVVDKARQRLLHSGRPGAGAQLLADRVLACWRSQPELLDGMTGLHLVDESWLSELLADQRGASAATIGFLASLQVMAEAISLVT